MSESFAGLLACFIVAVICVAAGTVCARLDRLIDAVNDLAYDDDDDGDGDGDDDGEPLPVDEYDCECDTVRFAS